MQSHKDSYTGSRSNIVRIRYEHIGIADYYLNKKFISSEHIKILKLFKSHNLALLFAWFIITFNIFQIFISINFIWTVYGNGGKFIFILIC